MTIAKLQNPITQSLDKLNDDLKDVYTGLNKYGRALEKVASQEHLNS